MSEEDVQPDIEPCYFNLEASTLLASALTGQIIERVERVISEKELLTHLPQYVYNETMVPIHRMFEAETLIPSESMRIYQQEESAVPRIAMDSIAPKQMKRERRHDSSRDHSISSPKSNHSKIKRNISRINSMLKSDVGSPKLKAKVHPEIVQLQANTKFQVSAAEAEEVAIMRRQKQFEQDEKTKQAADELFRSKRLKEAREKVESTYANGYTFDNDGSILPSEFFDTDKMNVHLIRLNMTRIEKLKVRQRATIPQQSVELKSSRKKDQYNTIEVAPQSPPPKPAELPSKEKSSNSKYARMHREQYSQVYGNRYSPWINRPNSKGLSLDRDASQQSSMELVIGQRRSRIVSGIDRSLTQRQGSTILQNKFTLPKLRGRYSLLDKYATVDASGVISNFH